MRPIRSDDDRPSTSTRAVRQIRLLQQPRPHRVVDVVIHVGDDVGDARDLPFDGAGAMLRIGANRHAALPLRVPRDAVAHFPRQVEALAVVLQHVDDAQALLVVIEPAGNQIVEDPLAGMPERRVPEIVAEGNRFGQLLVQAKHLGDAAGDLGHLEGVRQPGAVVVAGRRKEHLRLVLEAAEGLAVDDPIAIALKRRTDGILGFGAEAAARVGALGRLRREDVALPLFELFTNRHTNLFTDSRPQEQQEKERRGEKELRTDATADDRTAHRPTAGVWGDQDPKTRAELYLAAARVLGSWSPQPREARRRPVCGPERRSFATRSLFSPSPLLLFRS